MMSLLHRSAKRLLLGPAETPLHAFLRRYLLQAEPVHKNIINICTRQFSVFAEDHMHETALKNQQQGRLSTDVYWDVPHTHTGISEQRKCKAEHLVHELAGGTKILNSVTHVDDSACTLFDDSVSKCILASQKGYEKRSNFVVCEAKTALQANHKEGNSCKEGISEIVVADAGIISHKNKKGKQFDSIKAELVETNFLSKQKEGNKYFDCSASELAIFDPCKASCKDSNKEKHLDSSIREHALETTQTRKFLTKDKQARIVNDSTSELLVCNIKRMSQNYNAEFMRKEGLKLSVDNTETGLQREDIGMVRVKDASEVCVRDAKTSSNKNAEDGTCSDFSNFHKGVGASEKVESFTKEQVLVSRPHKRVDFAISKIKKNKKKKKKNTNRQFGPEDLKHLSLAPHPFRIAASGQGLCKEKVKRHGGSSEEADTCLPNYSSMQSKITSPVARQESSEYVYSNDSMSREVLKLKDKEKRESVDTIFANRRQVNQCITNGSVEEKQKLFICENSSKSRLHQDQKSGEVEPVKRQDTEHRTGQIWRLWEKGPLSQREDAHRPLLLVEKEQGYLNALSHKEVTHRGSSSQTHLMGKWQSVDSTVNKGKKIDYNQIKDGTILDPPSSYWEQVRTIAPVETIECAVGRAKWDLAGVRKVHYPLKNYRELYIILDLNGVLIKRWDKNPSLPGVCKLNKKWIQVRPGCIEFLQKAFSSFRVGIWSTMTHKNVLNMCSFLEQQAHQSLPFFMLWSKDSCYQHRGVRRPNKANVVADFKPLSRVWGYFKPYLGFHNTLLVDDSPYKACMNNPYNCIFPDAFEGCTDDKYLNDVLWPYLEKMRMSHNIQAHIANNPFGQLPVVVGHELYHHVQQVMDVFDCRASLLRAA